MEAERITLNQRERDRLRVLNEIRQKHITQTEAAQRLKISDRHIRRLLVAVAFRGDRAVVHGLRGRASNRRLATRLEEILSVRVARQVAEDHTVSWDGTRWACHAKKCVPVFGVRRWKLNAGWMGRTGCASAAVISAWPIARHHDDPPRILPAYGLQDSRNQSPNPKLKLNPNTTCPLTILGRENHGSGHFYLAENRPFLLCVDSFRLFTSFRDVYDVCIFPERASNEAGNFSFIFD